MTCECRRDLHVADIDGDGRGDGECDGLGDIGGLGQLETVDEAFADGLGSSPWT